MALIGNVLSKLATLFVHVISYCIHHPISALLFFFEMMVIFYVVMLSHEAAHYLVAKAFHCTIAKVQIGGGSRLLHWVDRTGTQFDVFSLPVSGYVRVQSLKETGKHENKAGTLEMQPAWKRILINLAGFASNAVLALALFPLWGRNDTIDLLSCGLQASPWGTCCRSAGRTARMCCAI